MVYGRGLVSWRMVCLVLLWGLGFQAVAATQDYRLHGDFVQGGILFGSTSPGSKVFQDEESVSVSAQGHFLLAFGRDAATSSLLRIELADGRQVAHELQIAPRDYQVQRIDGLPPGKVSPHSREDLERIRRDNLLVADARRRDELREDFLDGFIWPVTGRITGVYGSQRVLNGEPRRPHFGVDIAAPVGTPVLAPAAGVVSLAEADLFFSGGTLILDHGQRFSSTFLHLHRLHVAVGDRVQQGDVIAEVGATGRVTGAHLDWRMNVREHRVDPALLVPPMH